MAEDIKNSILTDIFNWIRKSWLNPLLFFIFLVLLNGIALPIFLITIGQDPLSKFGISVNAVFFLLFITVFLILRKIPKVPKDNVGFIIGISCETSKQGHHWRADFIDRLKEAFGSIKTKRQVTVLGLNEYHSAQIIDKEKARKYLRRANARFIIALSLRQREGREILDYRQGVVGYQGEIKKFIYDKYQQNHTPVLLQRATIAKDKVVEEVGGHGIKTNLESKTQTIFEGIEITSDTMNLISALILSTALLLSGEYEAAQILLLDIEQRIKVAYKPEDMVLLVESGLKERLQDSAQAMLYDLHSEWKEHRDSGTMTIIKQQIDLILRLDPSNYIANSELAIYYFVNGEVEKAFEVCKKCANPVDHTWMISLAFLYAYSGDMSNARKIYDEAFAKDMHPHIYNECEEFVIWVLSRHPDKIQLHFCLGLMNYHGKGDRELAKKDFKKFLELAEGSKFRSQVEEAKRILKV